eukprot:Lithocolla_globosa_v1_NODE_2601_length_1938_cov_11.432820.p1 type:complete len:515 gc:universal NODE_2601_length_1938_cov_11.432820:338-1882(+)
MSQVTEVDVVIIGAGISGLATAKCSLEEKLSIKVFEATDHVGGLWQWTKNAYGVMTFTHINVSKHNYCFSDFPFPEDAPDFVHHSVMAKYINDYCAENDLKRHIQFETKVENLSQGPGGLWKIESVSLDGARSVTHAKTVAVCTGHHAKPVHVEFPGQNTFKGEIYHSIDFKDPIHNNLQGKNVVIVGIGNSAVDVAANSCLLTNKCYLSTRSGAWVVPPYTFGSPSDQHINRLLLWTPWQLTDMFFRFLLTMLQGPPSQYKLNPKQGPLQTQPTVSPTLLTCIQRKHVQVCSNISKMEDKTVYFEDGTQADDVDVVILCTGFHIDLPFLSPKLKEDIGLCDNSNDLPLYMNCFSPAIGSSLAFIGFLQPASGGLLPMSEIQARWLAQLHKNKLQLPSPEKMKSKILSDGKAVSSRYSKSSRHTIQRDPILYVDEVAALFGAKPQLWRHPRLIWQLLAGCSGCYQYRLQGPGRWAEAERWVRKSPPTPLTKAAYLLLVILITTPSLFKRQSRSR